MKEKYEKPYVLIEDFKLSQVIANGCFNVIKPNIDQFTCPVDIVHDILGPINIFAASTPEINSQCKEYAQDGDNGVCYHVSQDTIHQS